MGGSGHGQTATGVGRKRRAVNPTATMIVAGLIVLATLVVMTTGWVSPIVALASALVLAGILRIAPASQLFAGLSNPGVITVGAMLVIARGVVQTGVVSRMTRFLLATVTTSSQALRRLALPVGVASAVMNTTPIVAMLIPATKQLEQTREIPAREVMLLIAHITTLAGTITLIGTSSNLLIGGIAKTNGVEMGMLSFAAVALPVAVFGVLVIYFVGPRLLRAPSTQGDVALTWRVELRVVAAQRAVSLRRTPLVPGATVFVTARTIADVERNEAIAMWQDAASRVPQPGKTWIAVSILAAVILSASFGLVGIEFSSVGGAVLMVLTGVLTPRTAARALDWTILFVLAGSVGLGAIVLSSGLADLLASGIRYVSAGSALLVVIVLALVTTFLTNLVTNAAAASILTPVAISLATELGVNPVIVLALIGTCISFTFINPFSHQTNLMVIGPIDYSTKEFVRFGIPVLLVSLAVACATAVILK